MAGPAQKAPDTLGKDGRAQVVINMLRNIQSQLFTLDVEVKANGLSDDDPAPAAPQRTVKDHRAALEASEKRIVEEYGDVMDDIRRITGS